MPMLGTAFKLGKSQAGGGDTSILGLSGMSYWVAGQETDSQNLTQLGSSGAGDAQFGSTSGADSNDPTALPWYATDDYDVTVDGVNYKYLTDNLVTNGTFDSGGTGWQNEGVWTFSGGVANGNGANAGNQEIYQSILTAGKTYMVQWDVVNYVSGTVRPVFWSTNGVSVSGNGTYTQVITTNGVTVKFSPSNFFGSIDNVVVREVTANLGDHVYLPGTSGNYLSHPDSAAVSVTGDITIQVECALDDWNTGSSYRLISKRSTSTNFDFFHTGAGDELAFWDGTTQFNTTTTLGATLTDGVKYFLRVVVDVDNGASAKDVDFYYSLDGESFTQIGTTRTAGSNGNLTDTTDPVEIGSRSGGTLFLATGSFYSAYIWDSDIGSTATSSAGTPVLHWEASSMTQSGGADEESGSSWTINRSASGLKSTLVTRPVIVFNSAASTYLTVSDHDDLDITSGLDFTVWFYGRQHDVPTGNAKYVLKFSTYGYGINESATGTSNPELLHYVSGDSVLTGGVAFADATASIVAGGRDSTTGFIRINGSENTATVVSGDLSNASTLKIGTGSPGSPVDFELFAAGVIKGTALTADQLASLKTELDTLLGGRSGE